MGADVGTRARLILPHPCGIILPAVNTATIQMDTSSGIHSSPLGYAKESGLTSVIGIAFMFILLIINVFIAYYIMETAVANGTYKAFMRAKSTGTKTA